jgi:threonine/homoserine/homoserine lactone efflux protein
MAQQGLRIAGALYLMFLAWRLAGASVAGTSASKAVSFTQAALFQALNPKSWLKAITMASVFMPSQSNMLASALLVSMIGTMVGMPCSVMWALFGVSIRSVLKAPRSRRIFNLSMGAILLVLAVMFLR